MTPPAAEATVPHRRILAIVVALILYGSLYPWQFHVRHYPRSPLWILLHSWPVAIERYLLWDIGVNITLYLPLGLFGYLAVRPRAAGWWRILAPLALGLMLSASIEMLQLFDDSRATSMSDVLSNVAGTAAGIGVGAYYRARLQRFLAEHGAAELLRPSSALLLLSCWAGYQLFPLFPAWGRTHLRLAIAALLAQSAVPSVATLTVFAEYLAVARLIESLHKARTNQLLALLLLLAPVRLIVVSRLLTWADIEGAAAALALWIWVPRAWSRRLAPYVLTVALILSELAPFHFAAARPFSWVPFRGMFGAVWQDGFVVLFRKSFWYGSLIWLWRTSGRSLVWTTGLTAASLLLLERIQIVLPGRTPEVTDAVLAVLMGVLLWLLRDA